MSRIGLATGEIIGRWRVTGPAPAVAGVHRVRVADDTGLPGEALVVGSEATADARARFAERHRGLMGVKAPHLVRTLDVIVEPTRVIVVREPTEDHTMAAAALPLASDVVAAIGVRLATAVEDAGPFVPSAVFLHDIALDADGRPCFAPVGLDPAAVDRGALGHVAPEAFSDARPDADAALYGLGAVLYLLTTGKALPGRSDGLAPPPIPPSARRHGVPPEHDRAVLTLLDATPSQRRSALALLQQVAGDVPDLRPAMTTSRTGDLVFTTTSESTSGRSGREEPGGMAYIAPEAWGAMSLSDRAVAAGLAGVGARWADRHVGEGKPLVIDTLGGSAAARERAQALERAHGLPTEAIGGGGVPGAIPFLLAAGVSALPALLALGFLLFGLFPAALISALFAVAILVAGAVGGRWVGRGRRVRRAALDALADQRLHRRERSPDGRLDAAWERIARLRVQLGEQDHLPAPAEADLRTALKETEDRLEGIAEAVRVSGASLTQVDSAGLRTRLDALTHRTASDPSRTAERDRLAATVADLDAVDHHRQRILAEVGEVDSDLNNIAAALGRVGADDPQGLSQLAKTVGADERRRRAEAARTSREPQ